MQCGRLIKINKVKLQVYLSNYSCTNCACVHMFKIINKKTPSTGCMFYVCGVSVDVTSLACVFTGVFHMYPEADLSSSG